MGLINLKTNLKSLKYTNDRPAGGNSGQPFIQNPIIEEPGKLAQVDTDTILRGGLRAPIRAAEDVARMTKYLFNPKSPNGFLFITKQNLLSRTSVATEASITTSYGNRFNKPVSQFPGIDDDIPKDLSWTRASLNQGIYTPLSTLTQVGIGFLGNHLNTFGILPTDSTDILGFLPKLSIVRYEDVIRNQTGLEKREKKFKYPKKIARPSFEVAPRRDFSASSLERKIISNAYENRLVYLTFTHQYNSPGGTTLFNYNGGPGSILGIGKTTISFADKKTPGLTRTGENNILAKTEPAWFWKGGIKLHDNSNNYDEAERELLTPKGASDQYNKQNGSILGPDFEPDGFTLLEEIDDDLKLNTRQTNYTLNLDPNYSKSPQAKQGYGINRETEINYGNVITNRSIDPDLLERLSTGETQTTRENLEERVRLGDPGKVKGSNINKIDKINASRLYYSSVADSATYNDFVQFRIGAIDPENPNGPILYSHFRAFIDSFSDSYKGKWKGQNYMGRAEKFYKYNEFDRDVNMSFKVAAQSQGEMRNMYERLNFLASLTAPRYTSRGYMAGNIVKLTMGGYFYEQPGFIESVTFSIPKESPWEIAIGAGQYLRELPHIIEVKSFRFTPIHEFRPERYSPGGRQRYINMGPFGATKASLYDSNPETLAQRNNDIIEYNKGKVSFPSTNEPSALSNDSNLQPIQTENTNDVNIDNTTNIPPVT